MKNFIQRVFFPSYKRTIGVLVVLILVLSVPITLRLVGQQQDLRQRAAEVCLTEDGNCGALSCAERSTKGICESGPDFCFWYGGGPNEYARCVDNNGNMNSANICNGGHCYADQNYCVENRCTATAPTVGNCGTQNCDSSQTCIYIYSGGSTMCFSKGTAGTGAYCGSPTGPNNEACSSGSCGSDSLCASPSSSGGGGGTSGGAPATTSTELARPSVSGQGYTSGCNSITLTWGAVPSATSYIIRQYNQAGVAESAFDKTFTATGTSYTVTDLISNPLTAYFFNIYATNGSSTSKASSILAATGACTTGQVPPPTTPSQTCSTATCPAPNTCVNNVCTAPAATCSAATCAAPSTCVNNVCTAPNTTNATTLSFTISLPGIGISTNQKDNINQYPNKDRKPLTVTFWDAQGNNVRREIGNAIYSSQTGYYTGTISISGLSGEYSLKLRLPATLPKLASTKVVLPQTTTAIVVPPIKLISGKINHNIDIDNIGVDDYNLMISCINNRCNPAYRELADLNDDGKVDELDLNILYVGFANRKGD